MQITEGLVGWVIQNNSPLRIGNVGNDPRYMPVVEGMQSLLCVPLTIRGKATGAIILETNKPNTYSEYDENLLNTLAGSAAIALENAQHYEVERIRRQEAELLREATAALSIHTDFQACLDQILESMQKIVPHDSASIFLGDEAGGIEIVAASTCVNITENPANFNK